MELLRDRSENFAEAGVHPYGISRDSAWTHIAWMQALDLNFPPLSNWNGEAARGAHLQPLYHLWLPGHQVEHGRAPWLDPYSFRPESSPSIDFAGWPFAVPFWPLDAALGHVRAWNVFVLLTYLAAGGLACLSLRELGMPPGAALAGGLAFAIAPYRVAQSTGHLLGPISILLPP